MKTYNIVALIALIVVFSFIGGLLFTELLNEGLFVKWQPIKQPPVPVIRFVDVDPFTILAEAENQQVYSCEPFSDENCWIQSNQISLTNNDIYACSIPQKTFITSPPSNIIDSSDTASCFEAVVFTRYVLLEDGSIWSWTVGENGFKNLLYICTFTSIGTFLGIVLLVPRTRYRMYRSNENST